MAKNLESLITEGGTSNLSHEADIVMPPVAQYGAAVLLVAAATILAFGASSFVPGPGLTLVFVLPVVIAGAWLGWGPSVVAVVAGVLVFDFFFTQPFYSLRIDDPAEVWAASLLLITAAIVGAVAWQSRQRAFEARSAAEQSAGLHGLAHAIIKGEPDIAQAAAAALGQVFAAPAAVLSAKADRLAVVGASRGAKLTEDEFDAAADALAEGVPTRAQTYPHDQSRFDMWPVKTGQHHYVLAVDFATSIHERPDNAEHLLEIVAAYLASSVHPPR